MSGTAQATRASHGSRTRRVERDPERDRTSPAAAITLTAERALPGDRDQLLGLLVAVATRVRTLHARHPTGSDDARELDELIALCDAALEAVTPAPPPPALVQISVRPSPAQSDPAMSTDEACGVFDRWVYRRCPEPLTDGGRYRPQPPERLLERLLTVTLPIPLETRHGLGLGCSNSYARAASLLLWARHAPKGPNCPSLRAAFYFLADAQGRDLPLTEIVFRDTDPIHLDLDALPGH